MKTVCNDVALLTTVDLLEVELAGRAQEDQEERHKQKTANTDIASTSFTQKGTGKSKPKAMCRDFMTDTGCSKGGHCLYQHPNTVGRPMFTMRVYQACCI